MTDCGDDSPARETAQGDGGVTPAPVLSEAARAEMILGELAPGA